MKPIRDLRADEIQCRIQQVYENGLVLLLYKDARVDMNILDETFGAENWQRDHFECKGNLFCRIGIRYKPDVDEWIWKADCGAESNTEAEKGEASDSFKRAGTNVGIGRELYTAPFIWVSSDKCDIKPNENAKGKNDKFRCKDSFSVQSITIKDKTITALTIYNEKKKCVAFTFGKGAPAREPKKEEPQEDNDTIKTLRARLAAMVREISKLTGKTKEEICAYLFEKCGIENATTGEDYLKLIAYADVVITDNHEGQN